MFHFRSQWFFAALFLKYKIYCLYIYLHVTHSEVLVISIFSSPYRLLLSPYLISNHTIYILLQSTVISLIMADKHFCVRGGTHHNRKEWGKGSGLEESNYACIRKFLFITYCSLGIQCYCNSDIKPCQNWSQVVKTAYLFPSHGVICCFVFCSVL